MGSETNGGQTFLRPRGELKQTLEDYSHRLLVTLPDLVGYGAFLATNLTPQAIEGTLLELQHTDLPVRIGFVAHLLNNEGGDNTKIVKQTILPDIVFCKSLVHKLSSEGRGKLRDLTKEGVEREVKFALNCGLLSADDNSRGTVEYLLAELEEGGLHFEVGELSGVIFTLLHCPICIENPQLHLRATALASKLQNKIPTMASINGTSSDTTSSLVQTLMDLGPSCTSTPATLRDAIRLIHQKQPVKEATMAKLIHFFSAVASSSQVSNRQQALSASFVGVLINDNDWTKEAPSSPDWNLDTVSQVIKEYSSLNWNLIARSLDFDAFKIRDGRHVELLLALYRAGSGNVLPLEQITVQWSNHLGQLSLLENLLAVPSRVYAFTVDEEEEKDAAPVEGVNTNCPNPRGWASARVLQRLLHLSDDKALHQKVREIFVVGLLSCPEIILCALVRLQLTVAASVASDQFSEEAKANAGAAMGLKSELMRELIPLFFRPSTQHVVRNGPGALRRLWEISSNTVLSACIEAWRSTANESSQVRYNTVVHIIGVVRVLPSPETAIGTILNSNKDAEFSFTVAFVMADNDMLQLQPWLMDKLQKAGDNKSIIAVTLTLYLGKNFAHAAPRRTKPLISIENLATCLQFLVTLDKDTLASTIPGAGSDPNTGKVATIGSSIKALADACVREHPNLTNSVTNQNPSDAPTNDNSSGGNQDDIEEMANSYFQKIYTSEQSAREVVEMLKKFKTSGSSRENDIFACMIHNLFDEYRFFSKYPEKELRITGILFGLLIKEQLVTSITLGIALRYVLEALRKPPVSSPQSGKMFRFGMFALEQFKERLHEWPQYCSHIVQIPHLREQYAQLMNEIEGEMGDNQSQASASTGPTAPTNDSGRLAQSGEDNKNSSVSAPTASSILGGEISVPNANSSAVPNVAGLVSGGNISSSLAFGGIGGKSATGTDPSRTELPASAIPLKDHKPRKAVFGPGLGRAVNAPVESNDSQNEAPPDALLDRVQFLINNLAMSNVEQKSRDLKDMLESKYFGWLGNYLVVKRISTQPNFHSLYLSFLDNLGDYGKGLVEAILASVYVNVGKLLRSQKITTSTSERSLLKNLGSWLGQITLARNRPILQIMLDCKELLFQGYETGMLIAVTPFVAKILEGAKNSNIFYPPNPWLMGLLSVFRALYNVDDLKMNIKFEVEVLCKNLGLKLEDIPMRNADLSKRIPPVKEKNPDFNLKSQQSGSSAASTPSKTGGGQGMALAAATSMLSSPDNKSSGASTGGDTVKSDGVSDSGSQGEHQTVIPNLAAYVNVNPNLTQLFHQIQGSQMAANVTTEILKRSVPIAVDRAIREIIQPVVERSVSIACITAKAIVTKDFAMESDENKMRKAAQLMVSNLAGSLALVTCREPLHTSISSHLRQLLTAVINNASGSSGQAQLSDQEQSAMDQCVAICSTENLELGCMLIEKAATEKAVRDIDEGLSSALSIRKKHREQTGQPYYDMSIFHNEGQRYPKALPEPLRPKPGGLHPGQVLVYDAFQRAPRQPAPSAQSENQDTTMASQIGEETGVGSSGKLNLNALSAISIKLDSSVTTLLNSAGQRAQEISLAMIPPDHEIKQLIGAIPRVVASSDESRALSSADTDAVLSFSQGIFKRLYEVNLTERLRLETMVALLEMLNKICPQLGKDMGTWATYAPTKTDAQRKLHRTVLLLLVRSELIAISNLDAYLAKNADEGRDAVWLEFLFLFVRTACLENIASAASMSKMVGVIQSIAEDRAPIKPETSQTFRKAASRLLDELRGNVETGDSRMQSAGDTMLKSTVPQQSYEESSSMSPMSLKQLIDAPLVIAKTAQTFASSDPTNAKQLVTDILVNWLRVQNDAASNDKVLAQFLQRLQQQFGVGTNDDQTERFLRLTAEVVVESCIKNATDKTLNYNAIDGSAKLLSYFVKYTNGGGQAEQVSQQRLAFLNKVLGVITRSLVTNYEKSERDPNAIWDQRPWFRLLLDLVYELNLPNPTLDPIKPGIIKIFGSAFHVIQPLVVPGFSFAWLELISHRMFLSNLLLLKEQQGWGIMHQLMIDLLLFLEPHLRKVELTEATKKYYDGTLRVILMLLHDFPTFLAAYHLSFCNIIPENCVQLRNLILSAIPKGIPLHDPISRNFKIDRLPEIAQSPLVLSDVVGPLAGFKAELDGYLQKQQPADFLSKLVPFLSKDGKNELDAPKVNSLALYVGMQGIARLQNDQIASSLGRTPEMEVFQKLMDCDDRGRYISLNAIANQLRYPSSHTHYFSCVMLFLFNETKDDGVKEQVTRVLLERLITQRPHPWGLLITFIELIKNQKYAFWSHPFTRCASEIEKVFENVARSCMLPSGVASVGEGDAPQ